MRVECVRSEMARDEELTFAVILARFHCQWIFCRHRDRSTWEVPGGHREAGEAIELAARRELYEETGAKEFTLAPVCAYTVVRDDQKSSGMLFLGEVTELGPLPQSEIAEITLRDALPENLTYPQIQPFLFEQGLRFLAEREA